MILWFCNDIVFELNVGNNSGDQFSTPAVTSVTFPAALAVEMEPPKAKAAISNLDELFIFFSYETSCYHV
jgi:hypothetical protein